MDNSTEKYQQYFDRFSRDGLLDKQGFRSVLQCLEIDPPQSVVDEMFAEHDKDENSQLNQDEFYEWIKDRIKSKSEMRESLMQSLDILFPGVDRVSIDDLLAKLSELGETFDESESAYARMTLEEFDSNDDGAIDKSELMHCFYSDETQPEGKQAVNETVVDTEETTEETQETTEETQETTEETQETTEETQETTEETQETTEETQETTEETQETTEETQETTEETQETTEETQETTEETQETTEETQETTEETQETTEETQETTEETQETTEETQETTEETQETTEETQETTDETQETTEETQETTKETQETTEENKEETKDETQPETKDGD